MLQSHSCTEVRDSLRPLPVDQLHLIDDKRDRLERLSPASTDGEAGLTNCPDGAGGPAGAEHGCTLVTDAGATGWRARPQQKRSSRSLS